MSSQSQQQFIHYLQNELAVSEEAIDLALRRQEPSRGPLHMVLWQHGLINIEQLDKAFEWQVRESVANVDSSNCLAWMRSTFASRSSHV